jgi:hypothetical protein
MLFLPASFVTSLFGMGDILPSTMNLKTFGVIFSLVCGLTYLIILVLGFGGASRILRMARRKRTQVPRGVVEVNERRSSWWMWPKGNKWKMKKSTDIEKGE